MKAAAAQRDITPPTGMTIDAPTRASIGVHDPLFARTLVLDDQAGTRVAFVTLDLIACSYDAAEEMSTVLAEKFDIAHTVMVFNHPHSSRWLAARTAADAPTTAESEWNDSVLDAIVEIVGQAAGSLVPAMLSAGRADVQVGYNRRIMYEDGSIGMGDNKAGPVVPWVNVLAARCASSGELLGVLFEHAAHPVIVPDSSALISADYPGAAVARVTEQLGDDVVAMFGQGCGGNINAYPLRTTHENAVATGVKLGDAVLEAIQSAKPIHTERLRVRKASLELPSQPYPSVEVWQQTMDNLEADWKRGTESGRPVDWITEDVYNEMKQLLAAARERIDAGATPPTRRLDISAVMLGRDWCVIALAGEMFCQYELWVDKYAPFARTMTFAYANGGCGYIATDEALAMGEKGGYEAGTYPCWWPNGLTGPHYSPPAVGTEKRIQQAIDSLWSDA
jgi:neutral ceramidase